MNKIQIDDVIANEFCYDFFHFKFLKKIFLILQILENYAKIYFLLSILRFSKIHILNLKKLIKLKFSFLSHINIKHALKKLFLFLNR